MVRAAERLAARLARWVVATPPPVPPFREGAFRSRLHDEAPAAWLGVALGVTFTVCFVTGLVSHLIQHPGSWFAWPARPAGLYRVTQGLHVVTGLVSIPLLLIKLFVVYPHLWTWPPVRGLRHAVDRASVPALVGGSLFLLVTGVQNTMYWYPWGFFFPTAHYWAAWITIGALIMHIGAKAGIVRRVAAAREPRPDPVAEGSAPAPEGLTRRGVLGLAGAASGVVFLTTAGTTVAPLQRLALLSPRRPSVGPQGFPVNQPAEAAGVVEAAMDPSFVLLVEGKVPRPVELSLADLAALPQREEELPISCVEGWSATARWGGVALVDLLHAVGASVGGPVFVESLQQAGLYRSTTLNPAHASDPATLLALRVGGEPLHIDHGFPVRLIAPNNPGVLQTKWLARVEVL